MKMTNPVMTVIERHNKEIIDMVETYLTSKEGKKLLLKSVKDEVRDCLENGLFDSLSRKTTDAFYAAIEQSLIKRLRLQ